MEKYSEKKNNGFYLIDLRGLDLDDQKLDEINQLIQETVQKKVAEIALPSGPRTIFDRLFDGHTQGLIAKPPNTRG